MIYNYIPSGVCSRSITIDIDENDVIQSVTFFGGCNGNLKGISALVTGMNADDVIEKLKEIKCGFKPTSCPAQLAEALSEYKAKKGE